MPTASHSIPLALSVLGVIVFVLIAAAGFILVIGLCAVLLALIQTVLPAPSEPPSAGPDEVGDGETVGELDRKKDV
ncbi:MAG TPA: hypothetical protein VE219_02240 [Candidatus Sulfotelmatobacter sp.]|nr:hypothetical protein [Candidatus Sulfotelmatobacter sp.]